MRLHNISGTLEEAARIISAMSPEERSDFYDEVFKYEPSRPCAESAPNSAVFAFNPSSASQ
jgi:hypothetical protein